MADWWTDAGRGGQSYSWSAFAPSWPHDGAAGTVLYVEATAARGWGVCERQKSGLAEYRRVTYAEALRALPPELHAKAADAQLGIEEAAQTHAQKWLDRRARYRMERMEVVVGA